MKAKINFLTIIVMTGIILSCSKTQVVNKDHNTFFKTFETDSENVSPFVHELPDGGFMVISSQNYGSIELLRTDKNGLVRWRKNIPDYYYDLNGVTFSLSDDQYMLNSGNTWKLIDTLGNILKSMKLPVPDNYPSGYSQKGPEYYISAEYYNSGSPSNNYIYTYNKDLIPKNLYSFQDAWLGGKTMWYSCYDVIGQDYRIWGVKFPQQKWSWRDDNKMFVALMPKDGSGCKKQLVIDSAIHRYSDQVLNVAPGPDSSIVLMGIRTDKTSLNKLLVFVKIDKNLNLVWNKQYEVNGSIADFCNLISCKDGGLFYTGGVTNPGNQHFIPYILKIDKDGNKVWDKIIPAPEGGLFLHATDTKDGGYAFVGATGSFGTGKTGNRVLMLKTDKNGNY